MNSCRYVSDSEFNRWKSYENGVLSEGDRRCACEHIKEGVKVIYLLTHPCTYYWKHFHEWNKIMQKALVEIYLSIASLGDGFLITKLFLQINSVNKSLRDNMSVMVYVRLREKAGRKLQLFIENLNTVTFIDQMILSKLNGVLKGWSSIAKKRK